MGADDADVAAVLDDAAAMDTESSAPAGEDVRPDSEEPFEPVRTPLDLQEAFEEAESLLLATGHVGSDLPQGFKLFRLPTDHVM